jgi:RND family efflux transporter MFP subunit
MHSNSSLDSLQRPPAAAAKHHRPLPAWLVPAAIAAGFAVLFLILFHDRLLPATEVKVAPVLATPYASAHGEETTATPQDGGQLMFQASGWIEPAPLPIRAAALIDGMVESVHVLEGQAVRQGELLASLIDADALLALDAAKSELARLRGVRDAHLAAIEAARQQLVAANARIDSAATLRDEAQDQYDRLKNLNTNAVPVSEVVSARLRLNRESALKLAVEAGRDELNAELTRMELETKVKEHDIAVAEVAVRQAELTLARTQVTSPINGRVLRLLAAPGQKKRLDQDDPDSSTIAILYDPANLQVRVDVPLADAAGLQVGQPVRLRCGLLPEQAFRGEVSRIAGEADVQRNTLQAKVRILDPVEALRPEMLCRAEFLAPPSDGRPSTTAASTLALWIPEAALRGDTVWVCDPDRKRVAQRAVKATGETRDGHVRIADGLRPGEWVVLSPAELTDGRRVDPQPVNRS